MDTHHCAAVGQKNWPLLQRQAFRAISLLEYQIISNPWEWKLPLLDELTLNATQKIAALYKAPFLKKIRKNCLKIVKNAFLLKTAIFIFFFIFFLLQERCFVEGCGFFALRSVSQNA